MGHQKGGLRGFSLRGAEAWGIKIGGLRIQGYGEACEQLYRDGRPRTRGRGQEPTLGKVLRDVVGLFLGTPPPNGGATAQIPT